MRTPAEAPSPLGSFKKYMESLKPLLDADFTGHMISLLGDMKHVRSLDTMQTLRGGKTIRGCLLCLIAEAFGGGLESAIPRAVAVELIQTASLIHDDFVDQHRVRRHRPAVWTLEGARKAVLLGDIIFASAIRMMSEIGRIDGLIISKAIAEISLGAFREPMNLLALFEEIEPGGETSFYERIIYLKTGALFGAACRLGAAAARNNERLQRAWGRYGVGIGEAYQIADDLHEIEQILTTRSMAKSEMISLAPALVSFVQGSRPHILDALRRKSACAKEEMLEHCEDAAKAMKAEIKKRLQTAVAEIEMDIPANKYGALVREAPWEIIHMFNETRSTSSLLKRLPTHRR